MIKDTKYILFSCLEVVRIPRFDTSVHHAKSLVDTPDPGFDVDPNEARRKRRKTASPEHDLQRLEIVEPRSWADQLQAAASDDCEPNEGHRKIVASGFGSSEQTETKDMAGEVASSMEENIMIGHGARPPHEPELPDARTLPKSTSQEDLSSTIPVKMLQVRPDGTLSSPKQQANANGTRPKRTRGQRNKTVTMEDYVVIIKYGKRKKSRILLGQKINAILSAPTVVETAVSKKITKDENTAKPTKPTHPFFAGAIIRDSDQKVAADGNALDTVPGQGSGAQRSNVSPRKMRVNSKPANPTGDYTAQLGFSLPTLGSDHARVVRFPGAQEPIWPPAGMVRVGPLSEPSGSVQTKQAPIHRPRSGRKLKDPQIQISAHEDVLRPFMNLTHRSRAEQEGKQIREARDRRKYYRPQRQVMTATRLQDIIRSRLAHSFTSSTFDSSQDNDELNHSQISQPRAPRCLQRLLERIATTQSAFDKFECETLNWAHKYAPQTAEDVLQAGRDVTLLRDWLKTLTVSSVSVQNGSAFVKAMKSSKKKRRRAEGLDGFVISSDEEANQMDELSESENVPANIPIARKTVIRVQDTNSVNNGQRASHAVVLSGPSGCGKSTAIYAIAQELGFEVFEINAGSRRNGKDILDRVGDMTRNHLVKQDANTEPLNGACQVDHTERSEDMLQQDLESGRQATMKSFFHSKEISNKRPPPKTHRKQHSSPKKEAPKKPQSQKQSLILLDEVDVLFEEDKLFWVTVIDLILNSRRPVIMTCTDESLVPLDEMPLHGIFRIPACPEELAIDYLLLVACSEGHLLRRDTVEALYRAKGSDLRASLSILNFVCQMAIGDNKGGLEWMLLNTPAHGSEGRSQKLMRVVSEDTYHEGAGWLDGEAALTHHEEFWQSRVDLLLAPQKNWNANQGAGDMQRKTSDSLREASHSEVFRRLQNSDLILEAYSAGDLFPACGIRAANLQPLDPTQPDITEKLRCNYTEGHRLLQADLVEDQRGLAPALALALRACARRLMKEHDDPIVPQYAGHGTLGMTPETRRTSSEHELTVKATMLAAFDPIARASKPVLGIPKGSHISCFDGPSSTLAEDIAPYVRSIVSFDLRLEEQRRQLSALLAQPGKDGGKARRTRASRAALEGGSKANTRRERWFPNSTNFDLVLQTGGRGWQEAALAMTEVGLPEDYFGPDCSRASSLANDMEEDVL